MTGIYEYIFNRSGFPPANCRPIGGCPDSRQHTFGRGVNILMCEEKKPNLKDVLNNLRQPMPVSRKILSLFKNNMLKVVRRQTCCGHPGQPGC